MHLFILYMQVIIMYSLVMDMPVSLWFQIKDIISLIYQVHNWNVFLNQD